MSQIPNATKLAALWMDAMSKPGATQLRALGEVMADDFTTSTRMTKAEMLAWFGTWPGKSLFRTGTWGKPTVAGKTAEATCMFDSKAAYHRGEISLEFDNHGLIARAMVDVRVAPEPLGAVIHRVWGERIGVAHLPSHLEETYEMRVKKVTRLDNGVLRVDRTKGSPWVVRVFPADRPFADVKGDAAVLRFLEANDYPAERCVGDVSKFEGQGVLVTGLVPGKQPVDSQTTWTKLADLLGRLHALKGGPRAVKRASGGLHLYTADCSIRSEIETARSCLDAGAFRGKDKAWAGMRDALVKADDFASLPHALSHPDFHIKNVVATTGSLVPIDWAGVGRAPRVLSLGAILFYGSVTPKGWNPKRVDAMLAAYQEHVEPTAEEVDCLAEAMQHRMLIHEVYSWCAGMATRRKPASRKDWPHNNKTCAAIATHVRNGL